MRLFVILTSLIFASNANARILRRDVSGPAQQLVNDLAAIGSQCTIATNGVDAYTASEGYLGALTLQTQINTLATKFKTAITDCNAISAPMSDEDTSSITTELDPVSVEIESFLEALRSKKPVFDSVLLTTSLIKSSLDEVCVDIESLGTCLLNACTSDLCISMQEYVAGMEDECNVVVPLYS